MSLDKDWTTERNLRFSVEADFKQMNNITTMDKYGYLSLFPDLLYSVQT